jgi:hypothetical protein
MMKKWILLLVTLVISTHIAAQTLREALGDSITDYLEIVNNNLVDFQKKNLQALKNLLAKDTATLTPEDITRIKSEIDKWVTIVSPKIKDDEDFNNKDLEGLAEEVKEQLLIALQPATQPSVMATAAPLPAPRPTNYPSAAVTVLPDLTNLDGSSSTDQNIVVLPALDSLEETSSTDPDTVFLNHSDLFEDFMNEHNMTPLSGQDYQNALGDYLAQNGVAAAEYAQVLPELASRLYKLQTRYSDVEDDEDDDIDELLAQLSSNEADALADELGLNATEASESAQTLDPSILTALMAEGQDMSRAYEMYAADATRGDFLARQEQTKKQIKKALENKKKKERYQKNLEKRGMLTRKALVALLARPDDFTAHYFNPLQDSIIARVEINNGDKLNRKQCKTLLKSFLESLGLTSADYTERQFNALEKRVEKLHNELWEFNEQNPEEESIA